MKQINQNGCFYSERKERSINKCFDCESNTTVRDTVCKTMKYGYAAVFLCKKCYENRNMEECKKCKCDITKNDLKNGLCKYCYLTTN
jgi:hypothetical protein